MISKNFSITKKGYEHGYNVDWYVKIEQEQSQHHYNDGYSLYVTSFTKPNEPYNIIGISLLGTEAEICNFTRYYVENGFLKPAS